MDIEDCLLVIRIISDNFVEETIDLTNLDEEEYIEDTVSDDEKEAEAGYNVKVVKFDTACSRNMSGTTKRIVNTVSNNNHIKIQGFNGTTSNVDAVGTNEDGKLEYYVSSMPTHLTLLSAHDYVKDGAAVLFPDDGVVLRLTDTGREELQKFIQAFKVSKQLTVHNRTYEEVANHATTGAQIEQAMNNTATRYFNSKCMFLIRKREYYQCY